ncbi:uncharacterized protein LOC141890454 isoform X1 [Acropora palmata]|uniref:uncharacterized protein LOC141890454 isoform X1 n=1 Tax=Acropora palmata TaxID=6131 RepID=UPI003D9FFF39
MESGNESKGYVYCAHCDNVVSRSTFRRHERKRCSATSGSEIGQSQVTLYSSDSETSSSPVDEGEPVISSCTVRQVKDNNKHSIFNAFRMCPRRTRVCCSRRNVWRCNSRHRTENEKLRQEHEKTSKHQAEALNRIEQRLKEGETPGILRRRARPGARAREARNIAVPAACRRSVRKLYRVLIKREDFNGFELDENANSDNNRGIMDRVIEQVLHEYGGQERCPWSRAIMQAALQRYFLSCHETRRLKTSLKYEEHKKKSRKNGRQKEKLTRCTVALDMIQWQDANAKGRAAEVLLLDAMSSEESSYEDDGDGQPKVVGYKVKRLPWESRSLRKTKKNLDKAYQKSLTKRAKERTLPRTVSSDLSEREPPHGLPDWAVENCN